MFIILVRGNGDRAEKTEWSAGFVELRVGGSDEVLCMYKMDDYCRTLLACIVLEYDDFIFDHEERYIGNICHDGMIDLNYTLVV